LIYEAGKMGDEDLSPLVNRVALPSEWRFTLIRPRGRQGLSGETERAAFARLASAPATGAEIGGRRRGLSAFDLRRQSAENLLSAAAAGRFDQFSDDLYRFGQETGDLFAPIQRGTFAGPELGALIQRLRALGIRGVGQSSWGPTVFALLPSQAEAKHLVATLRRFPHHPPLAISIAAPDNRGARIEVLPQ
jgi:predicted sugar kinase